MLKKSIATIIIVVAIMGIAFAAYSSANTKNPGKNSTSPNNTTTVATNLTGNNNNNNNTTSGNVNSKTTTNTNVQTEISAADAQKIASTYIEVSNATAGTPELVNQSGRLVYIVPVVSNGSNVGEIDIDAQTGQNLGGAGGAP